MFDFLCDFLRGLFYFAAVLFFLLCLPFVVLHVQENWNAPEYPYSGFTPECPTWEAPENTTCVGVASVPQGETQNTLPPTYSLAVDSEF